MISSDAESKTGGDRSQEYLEGTYLTERKAISSEIALNQQALQDDRAFVVERRTTGG